jgi:hypothetical protein
MSERSSRRDVVILVIALAGCGGTKAKPAPEADPAEATKLAAAIEKATPFPAQVPDCKPEHYTDALSLTRRTLLQIANLEITKDPEVDDHINPTELDHPSLRALADPATPMQARRQAAAIMLGAKRIFLYRADVHNAPLAYGINELKRGHVAMRGIVFEKGKPICVTVFSVKNTKKVSEAAMDEVERSAGVTPEISRKLREDLRLRLQREATKLGMPRPTPPGPAAPDTDD